MYNLNFKFNMRLCTQAGMHACVCTSNETRKEIMRKEEEFLNELENRIKEWMNRCLE